jgi:hypothetical protein
MEEIQERAKYAREQLKLVNDFCGRIGTRLLIVLFPDNNQVIRNYENSSWPSVMTEVCEEVGIPHLDLTPTLREMYAKLGSKLFTPYDPTHFQVEGNHAIARAVLEFVKARGALRPAAPSSRTQ